MKITIKKIKSIYGGIYVDVKTSEEVTVNLYVDEILTDTKIIKGDDFLKATKISLEEHEIKISFLDEEENEIDLANEKITPLDPLVNFIKNDFIKTLISADVDVASLRHLAEIEIVKNIPFKINEINLDKERELAVINKETPEFKTISTKE